MGVIVSPFLIGIIVCHSADTKCTTGEEKKVLITILGKLYIPADADVEKLRKAYELVAQAIEDKVANDAPSRNTLNKMEVSLGKIVGDLAEAAREETMIVGSVAGDESDAETEAEEDGAIGKGLGPGEEAESEVEGSVAADNEGRITEEDEDRDVTIKPASEDEDEL